MAAEPEVERDQPNVAELFFAAAATDPSAPAFLWSEGPRETARLLSFAELRLQVEQVAGGLIAAGLRPGERVIFMVPMSPALYASVLGVLTIGGVAVFLDPWVSLREIARMAAAANAAAFIGTPKAHLLRIATPGLRNVRITVATRGLGARWLAKQRLDELRGTAAPTPVPRDATALVTYTTGSSGRPKGVNRTHAILAAQHAVIRSEFNARSGDVDLTTFPVFALSNLAAGVATVIPPLDLRRVASADGGRVWRDVTRFGVTTMAASPPLFDILAGHAAGDTEAAKRVRRVVTGGAPVRDDQLRRWSAAFPAAEIVVAYGSSEAEPVAAISAPERLALGGENDSARGARAGGAKLPGYCAGRPVQAVRTRIVAIDKSGGPLTRAEEVPSGSVGELLVSGAHVCRDYAGDETAFRENKWRDPDGVVWHRMGDTGYLDRDGRFWLVGRVHSTIRRGGSEFHAQLVEQAARGDDARIVRVAALGLPDAALEEKLVLVVQSSHPEVASDVWRRLNSVSPQIPLDRLVVTNKALPVDPRHNSKVDYNALRGALLRGELE